MPSTLHLSAVERAAQQNADNMPMLQAARAELDAGLAELHELARGIHPTLLTSRGLIPAVRALTDRSAVAVDLHDGLRRRLEPAVETALYYTVAETLTTLTPSRSRSRLRSRSRTTAAAAATGCAAPACAPSTNG